MNRAPSDTSRVARFFPDNVTGVPPISTMLDLAKEEIVGASYETCSEFVPMCSPTVICTE
eukprot:2448856-Rhodomonas_salina.2